MNITKITIGRLFNLGSYEHVRYELTAEVHAGESAEAAMIGLERIVEALNPKRTCKTWEEIQREERRLLEMRAMDDEAFSKQHGHSYKGTRDEYTDRVAVGIVDAKLETDKWEKRHEKARRLLNNIGGAEKWKDAKLDWETDSIVTGKQKRKAEVLVFMVLVLVGRLHLSVLMVQLSTTQ